MRDSETRKSNKSARDCQPTCSSTGSIIPDTPEPKERNVREPTNSPKEETIRDDTSSDEESGTEAESEQ